VITVKCSTTSPTSSQKPKSQVLGVFPYSVVLTSSEVYSQQFPLPMSEDVMLVLSVLWYVLGQFALLLGMDCCLFLPVQKAMSINKKGSLILLGMCR
jgi:hypothetical protein